MNGRVYDREFDGPKMYGRWGTWIVVAYFLIPTLMLVIMMMLWGK